jgi:hypothetical protein
MFKSDDHSDYQCDLQAPERLNFYRRTVIGATSEICAKACLYNDPDSPLGQIDG